MKDLTMEEIAEAVARQIPKKVVTKTTYYDELIAYDTYKTMETRSYRCPTCGTNLFHEQKYCSECGQRLDFGGV